MELLDFHFSLGKDWLSPLLSMSCNCTITNQGEDSAVKAMKK